MKIGFIGAGKMAEALMEAIMDAGIASPEEVIASDRNDEMLTYIRNEKKVEVSRNNNNIIETSDVIFICVKPQDVSTALASCSITQRDVLFISIAAGVTLKSLESMLPKKRVVRVMPNTPCLVGEMAAGFTPGNNATEDDITTVKKILGSAGIAFQVEEKQLDIVTALSGSGPAFFTYFIKAMIEEAVKHGLPEKTAFELACQTALGTGKLLSVKNMDPDELIKIISSPGGTTVAGRDVLENSDVYDIIKKTIRAAYVRSRELGEENGK